MGGRAAGERGAGERGADEGGATVEARPGDDAVEERQIWEIRVGVYATRSQMFAVSQRMTEAICGGGDFHPGPCAVPWSAGYASADELEDDYEELIEQFRAEHPDGGGSSNRA